MPVNYEDFKMEDGEIDFDAYRRAQDRESNLELAKGLEEFAALIRCTEDLPLIYGHGGWYVCIHAPKGETQNRPADFEKLSEMIGANSRKIDHDYLKAIRVMPGHLTLHVSIAARLICKKEATTCEKWVIP